ncbi:MAG: hypothetical protein Q8P77_02395 [Candidatus Veblenbacteria bacterium]|nr:hypothetical protein [Candidatus Veblenbacteria bacterium]
MKLKNDKHRKARGGTSRLLSISCEKCGSHVFYYQKDGPGILKRLYLDRIYPLGIKTGKQLVCKHCKELLGMATIYKKEKRPAYRLFAGAISKELFQENKIK